MNLLMKYYYTKFALAWPTTKRD